MQQGFGEHAGACYFALRQAGSPHHTRWQLRKCNRECAGEDARTTLANPEAAGCRFYFTCLG